MLFATPLPKSDELREQMRSAYRADEDQIIADLLPIADLGAASRSRIWAKAHELVVEIRNSQVGKGGVDALLNEFSLSTEEGIVLMCLAEALLRVPDKETADRLIRDKLAEGDWSSHIGNSESLFVNASAWGLLLTGKMVNYSDKDRKHHFGVLKRTVGNLGEPVIRSAVRYAMQIMGSQFVMGKTIDAAIERAKKQEAKGYRYSYDMLGEGARTQEDADRYFQSYLMAINEIGKAANGRGHIDSPGISVKLSAIHPRYEFSHRERVMEELVPRLKELAIAAKRYDIGFTVDAEEADRLDISLDVIAKVFCDKDLDGWEGFGLAVQAYQKRARFVIEFVKNLAEQAGRKMMVRLVKGAYWDSEIKWSQAEGYEGYPVFTRKPSTDVSYQACAHMMMEYRDFIYPQFATHNAYSVATILEMDDLLGGDNLRKGYEFQRLHGMGESLYDQIVEGENLPCRVYAPVGQHADLLAYLVRRLLENGANSSFVNNIVDEDIPVESLLKDPVEQVKSWKVKRSVHIPLPKDLYGEDRKNSLGVDLTHIPAIESMAEKMNAYIAKISMGLSPANGQVEVRNPANHQELIGVHNYADEADMEAKLTLVQSGFDAWSARPVSERAEMLRKLGDELENNFDQLMAICVKEAGKNVADSVAEIREAVDFCHYYADQAEQLMAFDDVAARGVILCISPWNFPLAIFLGQVVAALAVGNTVIAKPAEQTAMVAEFAVELMRRVGFTENIVQLIIATGKPVGEKLVPDSRIRGVMFTGSTETGLWIGKTLASRPDFSKNFDVPLIAETGGQNAMIVDSTALPEQVVDDVISSGFQSAGQRCSALRVLFLQEDVADKIINMIQGAMKELHIGDPSLLATDVGPVIDQRALTTLTNHVEYMKENGELLFECPMPSGTENGNYFAPRLYEISDLSVLKREVFGPVVHVIRYKAKHLDKVIDQINATGYGLTMGIHSRIERGAEYIANRIKVGNVYINRNMIGAVVGVQPFGGRGLSGTGPKAGGPLYLTRLVKARLVKGQSSLANSEQSELAGVSAEQQAALQNAIQEGMTNAVAAQQNWNDKIASERVSLVRQMLAKLSTSSLNIPEAKIEEYRHHLYQADKYLSRGMALPGPTGESNQLFFDGRGVLALILDDHSDRDDWLLSLLLAVSSGNGLLLAVSSKWQETIEQIQKWFEQVGLDLNLIQHFELKESDAMLNHPGLSGVIVPKDSQVQQAVQKIVANRPGAMIAVIQPGPESMRLPRFICEKTITIDTTAAGGNASLMTMAE